MLEARDISLFYGSSQALRGVSLTAEAGHVTCVLGRNGVGKTSLMRAIVGQQPVSAGRIALDGEDLTRTPSYRRAAKGVAFVPQGREIFPLLTVEENLKSGFAAVPRNQRNRPGHFSPLYGAHDSGIDMHQSFSRHAERLRLTGGQADRRQGLSRQG